MSSGSVAASNLQLLRRDALLKNFSFQPQVLSVVHTALFEESHVVGPEPKVLHNVSITSGMQTGCQDLQSLSRRRLKKLPQHQEDTKSQDTTGQDFCVWPSGVYKSTHHSEYHHTGHAVLSCRVRVGRSSTSQCVPPSQVFWSNPCSNSRPTLMWHRWGLAW